MAVFSKDNNEERKRGEGFQERRGWVGVESIEVV